jgi:hypothetical protein
MAAWTCAAGIAGCVMQKNEHGEIGMTNRNRRMGLRLDLRLGGKDRERLELISAAYGISLSSAIRMAIRAACVRLGIETGTTEDLLQK